MHGFDRVWILLLLAALIAANGSIARSADTDPEFAAAKTSFLKEMKKRVPTARAEAVAAIAKVPRPETADLLIKRGLTDDDDNVQQAARKSLRVIAQDPTTASHMAEELKRSVKKQISPETLMGLLGSLVATEDRQIQLELVKIIDDYLASPRGNLLVPMTVIDELGQQGGADAFRGVSLLARAKAFDSQFGYRRCVVQALSKLREPDAIGYLIDMIPRTQGLVQYDIIQYLTKTTKQKFRDNDRDWGLWWKENQAKFQFPAAGAAADVVDLGDDKNPTYYGIPICAKRIVFVLDTSASMRGQPMEAAKVALLKTVEALPEAVNFDIIMFDRTANAWVPRLVPATYQAKQEAAQTVMSRGMGLGTASHAALNAAFTLEPEVIYFLSDGEPTDGQPAQIVSTIAALNRTHRVSIHTIGVVTQRGGGAGLTFFMQPLAQQNYGSFRLIE